MAEEGKQVTHDNDGDDDINGDSPHLGLSSLSYLTHQQRGQSPLGLKLTKSSSFVNLLKQEFTKSANDSKKKIKMTQEGGKNISSSSSGSSCETGKIKIDYPVSQKTPEKLKASNFPAQSLKIGNWERYSKHEGDLVVKCYYAKRKLVWEILHGGLKSKIEIHWADIIGIRGDISDHRFGVLDIELKHAPKFYHETDPRPRKHTLWLTTSDFTGGEALKIRRHTVTFRQGYLDNNFEKLLQCDSNLLMLSQKPFPTLNSPYFHEEIHTSFDSTQQNWAPSFLAFQQQNWVSSTPMPEAQVMNGQLIIENQRIGWERRLENNFGFTNNGSGMSDFHQNIRIQLINQVEYHSQVPYSSEDSGLLIEDQSQEPASSNEITYDQNTYTSFPNVGNNNRYQIPTVTNFENANPIISANPITSFDIPSSSGIENNFQYQIDGYGNYKISPQFTCPSIFENQVRPQGSQLFQDYNLPYQHQLSSQQCQDYEHPSFSMVTNSSCMESSNIDCFTAALDNIEYVGGVSKLALGDMENV